MRQVNKQHYNVKFGNWGPKTIWHNLLTAQLFSLKNHSTLIYNTALQLIVSFLLSRKQTKNVDQFQTMGGGGGQWAGIILHC